MQCLIYQPLGLGDILWVQSIVDHYIEKGYEVIYPVGELYYDMVSEYIQKPGLTWYHENDDYPMKYIVGQTNILRSNDQVYLPLRYADLHINISLMLTKYAFAELPLPDDYRNHFDLKRNYEREQKLIDTYNLHGDYVLVNENFATPPTTVKRTINVDTDLPIYYMDIEKDNENGFHLFDWIGALQSAKAIHSVGTSICYLIDKYCDNDMHIYERRAEGWPRTFHQEIQNVHKNPRWVYED